MQYCTESTVVNKSQEGTNTTAKVNCSEHEFYSTCEMKEIMLHHFSSAGNIGIMNCNRLMCARDYRSAHEVLIL
jgi:hypothetical protein